MNSKTILQQKAMFYTCNNSLSYEQKKIVTLNLYLGGGGWFVTIFKLKNINLTHMFSRKALIHHIHWIFAIG
jgi:hypothetical protein